VLLNARLAVDGHELGHDLPCLAPAREMLVVMLDPDHRHPRLAGSVDEPGDVRDHPIPPIRLGDNAGLDVNNQQSRVGPVLERGHIAVLPLVYVNVHPPNGGATKLIGKLDSRFQCTTRHPPATGPALQRAVRREVARHE